MPSLLVRFAACLWLALALVAPAVAQSGTASGSSETTQPQKAVRATVINFESETQVNALAAKSRTVVFFFASWCPNCRATVTELNARWADVNPDLTLVIADYDKETTLKGRYGVTYQDTFVLLDAKGEAVKSWNSGGVDGLNANSAL
ncbi:thioredoxin family protein [Mesorhizobium sp. DCY119]|uniref:TlpA family protein disulfide reductase n=1 Tax=Mesorhizobium sp. DCY119 TaxID=2108445 RepID=UPI0014021E28|nr:thioredoxin family protein [Mesorhizobium sp. DCY119]